eukprot:27678-Rhodomonas_salina.1
MPRRAPSQGHPSNARPGLGLRGGGEQHAIFPLRWHDMEERGCAPRPLEAQVPLFSTQLFFRSMMATQTVMMLMVMWMMKACEVLGSPSFPSCSTSNYMCPPARSLPPVPPAASALRNETKADLSSV